MMENDFKVFITVSIVIHASLFAVFSMQAKRAAYIVLPIDLLLNTSIQQETTPGKSVLQSPPPAETLKKKEKEITVPKKSKAKAKKPAPKKAEAEKSGEGKEKAPPAPAQQNAQAQPSGFSGSLSLDTAKFPYAYYTNTIVRKIGRYWQWSNEFGRLRSVVFFRILRDGKVSEVTLKEPSGDRLFDEQAVRAVKLSVPFPPLPDGYPDGDLGVYFEFSFRE